MKRPGSSASARDEERPRTSETAISSQWVRRKAAIECLSLLRHLNQKCGNCKAFAIFHLEGTAPVEEGLASHGVNIRQRAARERGKAEAQNGAHIGLADVG